MVRGTGTTYAASALLRSGGTVTAMGGAHARSYPEDARRWFDFVLRFTDREAFREALDGGPSGRDDGRLNDRLHNPASLPTLERRAEFVDAALGKARLPGIENWYDYGAKMGPTRSSPEDRMGALADRLNAMVEAGASP